MGVDAINDLAKTIPESVYMCFQMTFAIITPALIAGAFAERMKFSALLWFIGAVVRLSSTAPIAHWVWGGGFLGDARRARLRRRHGGAHQRRRRRPDVRPGAGQARGLRQREHGAAQPGLQRDRRLAAVGRLVRLQRRLGGGGQRHCRHGDGGHPVRHRRGGAGLDVRRVGGAQASRACSASSPARSPAWSRSRRPPASSIRRGALVIGIVAGVVCYLAAPPGSSTRSATTTRLDAFGVHGVGGIVGAILTGVLAVAAIGGEGKSGLIDGNAGQV